MADNGKERTFPVLPVLAYGAAALLGWRAVRRLRSIDLADRSVLITGGSRGLGLALAEAFGREGARVVICGRDRRQLEGAVRKLDAQGVRGRAIRCDVSDRRRVTAMVRRVEEEFGGIDVLVNNASVVQVAPLDSMTVEDFEEAMAVNFWGTVHPTLEVLPRMRERGEGRIANITSIGGKVAVPHLLPYDCAKFASVGFSEGLRAEMQKHGILVTTVVPGLMRTGGPVNAYFKGDAGREFAWFSLADATSLTAMSARRAARRIVKAVKYGEAEVTLSWQARTLRLVHDVLPGMTTELMALVNRALPEGDGAKEGVRGMEIDTAVSPSRLTRQMNQAARTLNQYGGRPRPSRKHAEGAGLEE